MKILNKPTATVEQINKWLEGKNPHPLAKAMVPLFYEIASKEGVDPTVVIAQAMKETGYFKFKGVLRPNFCNTCGLKVKAGGSCTDPNAHMRFEYWEDGILAHVEHIALYAGAQGYPLNNPMDTRHFPYLHGKCPNVEDLSGNWAPSKTYGQDLVKMCEEIINTKIEPVKECLCDSYKEQIISLQQDIEDISKELSFNKPIVEKYNNLKKSLNDILN